MGFLTRVGRLCLFLCFVGFAIIQLQYPQTAITQTHEKTNQFYYWLAQITSSVQLNLKLEDTPLIVFSCAILKIFVGIGILMKWRYAKLFGSLYLISAIFVVYNPLISKNNTIDPLLLLGVLGGLQFA